MRLVVVFWNATMGRRLVVVTWNIRSYARSAVHSSCSICVGFVLDRKLPRNWIDELLPTCKPEKARHRLLLLVLPDRTRDERRPSVSNESVTHGRGSIFGRKMENLYLEYLAEKSKIFANKISSTRTNASQGRSYRSGQALRIPLTSVNPENTPSTKSLLTRVHFRCTYPRDWIRSEHSYVLVR